MTFFRWAFLEQSNKQGTHKRNKAEMLDTCSDLCSNVVPFNQKELFMREYGFNEIAIVEIENDGVTRTLRDWAAVLSVPYPTVRMRYRRGKRAFSELFRREPGMMTHAEQVGETMTIVHQSRTFLDDLFRPEVAKQIREVAKDAGISPMEVVQRVVTKQLQADK
jgi:hypothetical protein